MTNVVNLKAGWQRVKFGDVVCLSKARSSDPIADGYDRYVGLDHIEPEDLRIRRWGNVADGVTFTSVFKPGQVLFGKRRAYQRKVAVADYSGVCSGDIYVLESKDPKILLPELLPFICQTEAFFQHAVGTSAGSLSPRTNWTSLADFEFVLPPLEEQRRVVSILCSINEQIDSYAEAIAALFRVKAATFNNFYLKANRLHPVISLVDGCTRVTDGTHQPPTFTEEGIPFFLVKTISSGFVDWSSTKSVSQQTYDELTRRVKPKKGDILYTAVGATYGVALLVEFDQPFVFQRHIAHIIPNPTKLNSRYVEEFINSRFGKRQSDKCAIGSAQPTVTLKSLSGFKLPCPPIEEQNAFATHVENMAQSLQWLENRLEKTKALRITAMNEVLT